MRILRIFLLNLYTYQPFFYRVSRIGLPIFPKSLISLVSHVASSSLLSFVDLAIWNEYSSSKFGFNCIHYPFSKNPLPVSCFSRVIPIDIIKHNSPFLIKFLYSLPSFLDPADCFCISSLPYLNRNNERKHIDKRIYYHTAPV